jgi:hypothetical protein
VPAASSAPSSIVAAPASTEIVHRPEPGSGLARGKWEAPPWAFYTAAVVVIVVAAVYLAHKMGLLRLRRQAKR